MKTALAFLATSTLLLHPHHAKTVEESSTGALLSFPSTIDGPLFNKTFEIAPAQFGYQKYGGALEGVLVLPANETYHKECPKCPYNGGYSMCTTEGPEPLGQNPYIHYINDWFIEEDDITDFILVVDRLDCYFVNKIEHAQLMGASGVIMCDWRAEHLFTMWMPTDWSDDIDIPSVLLSNKDCATLMAHLGVSNWDPQERTNMKYPTVETMNWTIATIEWGLPHPDDMVEYELWTSSNDYLGSKFKHNFNTTAIELDLAGDTKFTPHMYILNGSHWYCDETDSAGQPTLPCGNQCTNSGRYCAVDPEYDLSIGLDGMDVVQENVRSLCVWEYDKAFGKNGLDDILWWDYAVLWDEHCGVLANSSTNFHANCSFAQMDKLKTDQSLSTYVKQCIVDSGGYGYRDGDNTLLRTETKLKYNSSIYAVPLVRVNEFLIHGNIDCEQPVTTATCEVLAAICAGFIEGTQPDVCSITPSPIIVNCTAADEDCAGVCFGTSQIDACGKCLLVSSPIWNECIGCNGQINETYDCSGVCGGHYAVNPCGYCKDTRSHDFATFGVDCNGTCSMELKTDECGQCIPESSSLWNECVGCDNVPFSGYKFNRCGRCIPENTTNFADFGADCKGVCDGDAEYDECGVCLSVSSKQWNDCVGCDGVAYSNKTDNPCGFCIDSNDANWNDYGRDCRGNCSASTTIQYYTDECGQCLPTSSSEWNSCLGCDNDRNKATNPCGFCIFANATDFTERGRDCSGECGGKKELDSCNNCILTTSADWNNCTGCDGVEYSGFRINPCGECISSKLPNFETYGQDCSGECGGASEVDECDQCLPTSSTQWNACVGCDGVANSGKMFNDCGSCQDPNDESFDEYGRDCTGNCTKSAVSQHYVDECGQCLLTSSKEWNACVGCDGVAHSNMSYNPCGRCINSRRSDFKTYGQDCSGECEGDHEEDECGNCLLRTSDEWNGCVGCDGVANSGKIYNDCGSCQDPDDESFDEYGRDCTGNCAKSAMSQHYVDECGQCLLLNDAKWNKCKNSTTDSNGNGNSNSNGAASDGGDGGGGQVSMWYIIGGIGVFVLVIVVVAVFVWMCKRYGEMKRQFDEIRKNYRPMEDMVPAAQAQPRATNQGLTQVPDEEQSD